MASQKTQITGAPDQKMEARASVRYRFGTPAVFSWAGHSGGRLKGEGITRDISVGGAYILTPTCPPPKVVIQLEIFLTSPGTTGRSLRIAAEGRVLRVEQQLGAGREEGSRLRVTALKFVMWGLNQIKANFKEVCSLYSDRLAQPPGFDLRPSALPPCSCL